MSTELSQALWAVIATVLASACTGLWQYYRLRHRIAYRIQLNIPISIVRDGPGGAVSFDGADAVMIARAVPQPLFGSGIGYRVPARSSALGKVLLAHLDGPTGDDGTLRQVRDDGYCSIIGGYVIRDESLGAAWDGRYVYGDLCEPELQRAELSSDGSGTEGSGVAVAQLVSFGEDGRGRFYAISLNGPVYRLAAT